MSKVAQGLFVKQYPALEHRKHLRLGPHPPALALASARVLQYPQVGFPAVTVIFLIGAPKHLQRETQMLALAAAMDALEGAELKRHRCNTDPAWNKLGRGRNTRSL